MKDSISIIFAAIIGTFLIVILPLYSILDRQDSMSYNVVLTATTNFVDNVRNKGFIDRNSYTDYIATLASTSNTYKVSIEAYRKILINETDEKGRIIEDSFIEEKELYNTQDILDVLENDNITIDEKTNTNRKNNVYLLGEDDEIYVRVHNTNVTSGSIIYSFLAGATDTEVINISYGGIVNDVNWELYDKINSELELAPEVIMSVPVNAVGNTNVQKVDITGELEDMGCNIENIEDYIGTTDIGDLCGDILEEGNSKYTYLYDLTNTQNKTIKIAVELRRFAKIDGGQGYGYIDVSDLKQEWFNSGEQSQIEKNIISNYIKLHGMYANTDLILRAKQDYYVFEIVLKNVTMSNLDYISSLAHIAILPGLGVDENGIESLLAESVEIELVDVNAINTVAISMPHIWKKLIETKSLSQSAILNNVVYAREEIAFVISYTGINEQTDQQIIEALKQNLRTYSDDISGLQFYTEEQLNEQYKINLSTQVAGHVLVKFKYNSPNDSKENYVRLQDKWIETNIENVYDPESGEEPQIWAMGARSTIYEVKLDDSAPYPPTIIPEGTLGQNGWYTSDVTLNIEPPVSDTIRKNGQVVAGGSGVHKNTLILEGATTLKEQQVNKVVLTKEGTTRAKVKAYDYVGNVSTTNQYNIKIDKTAPTAPTIELVGTKGRDGWYTSDVKVNITPGTDDVSKVARTTYRIEGANSLVERTGTTCTLTVSGTSTIIATTYDNAGNKTETSLEVKLDKAVPPEAKIEVIKGEKNLPQNKWYYTDVTLRITVDASNSVSGLGVSSYRITGNSEVPTTEFEGNTKEITITTNGTHNITVYTFTKAGRFEKTEYTVNIDKDAPKQPTIKINSGNTGENDWYISDVELQVESNGDNGPSGVGESDITYEIIYDGVNSGRQVIGANGKIFFNKEGIHKLKLYISDIALNEVVVERQIKIDKTNPTSADFVIDGKEGVNEWYISDVYLSHKGAADEVSGIQSVTLSTESITRNTNGTKVTLTTKDNAGHKVTKDITIKLDKSVPTEPTIRIDSSPTGAGIAPWLAYNKNIKISIIPGVDTFLSERDNVNIGATTYMVVNEDTGRVVVPETQGTEFNITQEGRFTIYAITYDKAGNRGISTKNVWINKSQVATPKIVSINGTNVENDSIKTITSTTNKISLVVNNLEQGNALNIVLINQNNEKIEITKTVVENTAVEIVLEEKGTYSIKMKQTNMFGTTSKDSTGVYSYKYE